MDESHFPIEVLIVGEERKIFERPEDLPEGVAFKVLKTNVRSGKAEGNSVVSTN